ncbi:PDZ domain-containing protein [Conchiformibius steedae DSM 2580]|uniref:PDZ domain-containing protein n=1 Tax=Conchiformibius steedae DSM 2580 TaxID=1121352 RepID=A0AAE9HU15_9NEIS|nr:PDZ domain-containing protein [Conchiformibius steedae]QMT33176.1 M61 family metallopeptidase [Conchiformibius steedae]URD67813.1 PDZ domain-containing protein [Conchiformibius steedae DSM 2580]
MLHYTVIPDTLARQWHVTLSFEHSADTPQTLKLANWTPGSYMIRDFSRHITAIAATCNHNPVLLTQTAKNEWQIPARSGNWQISYSVYANDLSVRASLLDTQRGFIDGACLFLYLPERTEESHSIQFQGLPAEWRIHTAMTSNGEHSFTASDYAELIDHPFEMGANNDVLLFDVSGIEHRIVISGHRPTYDPDRLIADARKICEAAHNLFPQPAPFDEYVFLLHVGEHIYGGLEHRSSTALHIDRRALPSRRADQSPAYTELLGLISHEYFHSWHVKSIKPAAFIPYRLDHETYTEQLWIFEGITSYYDDLLLARSGVISPEHYLKLLAQTITRVWRTPGRKRQTLAQSAFCAWHKYYKQDENSPNAITSYYQQGALTALCLDLLIRARSPYSLDHVMQHLYQNWLDNGKGLADGDFEACVQEVTGLDLREFFATALHSTDDLPVAACLQQAGVEMRLYPLARQHTGAWVAEFPDNNEPDTDLGCRFRQEAQHALLSHVFNGGAAESAGLKPDDRIIAVDGFACTDFTAQAQTEAGEQHIVHFFRHGVLHQTELTVQNAAPETALLKINDAQALQTWLSGTNDPRENP